MTSNGVCNGVSTLFVTLTPTRPSPTQPSPAQPLSFWSPSTTSSLTYPARRDEVVEQ